MDKMCNQKNVHRQRLTFFYFVFFLKVFFMVKRYLFISLFIHIQDSGEDVLVYVRNVCNLCIRKRVRRH